MTYEEAMNGLQYISDNLIKTIANPEHVKLLEALDIGMKAIKDKQTILKENTIMTYEEAINIGLPKWPQCIIKGDSISEEQALEIIRRTDTFFNGYTGNNELFNKKAYEILNYPNSKNIDDFNEMSSVFEKQDSWRDKWRFIHTDYITNSWISTSYVYGPHGWCHPDGTIEYHHNIGKWPSVEEVFNELQIIAKEWTFLNMTVTLMSGEECEDHIKPLVSMKVHDGIVEITDIPSKEELTYEKSVFNPYIIFNSNRSCENYFSLDQIYKWADQVFKEE